MGRTSQGRLNTNKKKTTGRSGYVQGNVVRELNVKTAIQEAPRKQLSHTTRKNREKAVHMNFGYLLFLSAALICAGFVLIGYIQLQYEFTNSVNTVSRLESQLHALKLDNDEKYNRVLAEVDLEKIKEIAIGELGMEYAGEGQIVVISGEENDYVRQYADLPKAK